MVLFLTYCVFCDSIVLEEFLSDYGVNDSAHFPKKKDFSDYEWEMWKMFFGKFYYVFLIYACTSAFKLSKSSRMLLSSLLCGFILCYSSSIGVFILLFCQTSLMYISTFLKRTYVIWSLGFLLVMTLNVPTVIGFYYSLVKGKSWDFHQIFEVSSAFAFLRMISFCCERVKILKESPTAIGFEYHDMIAYVFYLPTYFFGPVITYDKFHQSCINPTYSCQYQILFKHFVRVLFWMFVMETSLYFLYFNSMLESEALIMDLSLWTFCGAGYLKGQFFMTKYVVIYGIGGGLAMLDGFDPPLGPKCIAHISRYSDMWRYFDRGLYDFIKRYIYIPLGGSRAGLLQQTCSSLVCFSFIYVWHGVDNSILAFCFVNFIGVSCERIGTLVDSFVQTTSFVNNSALCFIYERLKVFAAMPFLIISLLGVFTFLTGNVEVGRTYYTRMLTNSFPVPIIPFIAVLYIFIQSSRAINP